MSNDQFGEDSFPEEWFAEPNDQELGGLVRAQIVTVLEGATSCTVYPLIGGQQWTIKVTEGGDPDDTVTHRVEVPGQVVEGLNIHTDEG